MTLMFQRNARNYAVNGYFPTDDDTMPRICSALAPAPSGSLRLLDPCCADGDALRQITMSLGSATIEEYGIDIDEGRAYQAKSALTRVVHADLQECALGLRQFGLLFLNPPYGDLVSDRARIGPDRSEKRLEQLFYRLTAGSLQFNGVMVLIIPRATLNKDFAQKIARSFNSVRVFDAPEQRFNQLVIFGVKVRSSAGSTSWHDILDQKEAGTVLPEQWDEAPYIIPAAPKDVVKLHSFNIDERQLESEIEQRAGLWAGFDDDFCVDLRQCPPPLCQPTPWHLAMMLAGGAISGLVENKDGRAYVVSGDTMKAQAESTKQIVDDDDNVETVTTRIDRFVPTIRALDMSPTSTTFGETLIVR